MVQKVKLSRRQIKEDKFTGFMLQSRSWFQDNWQFVAIAVAALILIVSGASYWSSSRQSAGMEAATQLSRAMSDYRTGNLQVAMLGLQAVLDDHGSSSSAPQATFLLGNINLDARNYPEAMRYYEMYLSKYHNDKVVRASCLGGIAVCYEDQAQFAEAAAKFTAAYDEMTDGPLAGSYLTSAMRDYLAAGDHANAEVQLELLKKDFADTNMLTRAIRTFYEMSVG